MGLEGLQTISVGLTITSNSSLVSLQGLSSLSYLASLSIVSNPVLVDISALGYVSTPLTGVRVSDNASLASLAGLQFLSEISGYLTISGNAALTTLAGLGNLKSVKNNLSLENNARLNDCTALIGLLDATDDGEPGPGPGLGGVPDIGSDVILGDNQLQCNTVERIRNALDNDRDGIANEADNCPEQANPLQEDSNGDGQGDACPDQLVRNQQSMMIAAFSGDYADSDPCFGLIEINGEILANLYTEQYGCELFRLNSDGGYQLLADINNGPVGAGADINPDFGLDPPMSGWHYFEATDGINGNELWRTDGAIVEPVGSGNEWDDSSYLLKRGTLNGRLYYSVVTPADEYLLYSTDGTAVQLESAPGSAELVGSFFDSLFYLGFDDEHGAEPWKYDADGYQILADIAAGPAGSLTNEQNNLSFNDYWLFSARKSVVEGENQPAFYKTNGNEVKALPHSGHWMDSDSSDAVIKTEEAVWLIMQDAPTIYGDGPIPPIVCCVPPVDYPNPTWILRLNDRSTGVFNLGNHVLSDVVSTAAVLGDEALVLNDNRLFQLRETAAWEIALTLPTDWENSSVEFVGSGRYFDRAYIKETSEGGDSRVWAWSHAEAGLLMADDTHVITGADHFRHIGNDIYFYGEDDANGRSLRKIPDKVIKPIPLMGAVTGSWYDPGTSGQGFVLHVVDDERTVISFYGYDNDGTPLWLTGVGDGVLETGKPMEISLEVASGGNFGNFSPQQIQREPWGTLTITFNTCSKATAELSGLSASQTMEMIRLAAVEGLECYKNTPPKPESAGITGSWYDPETAGQGFVLHAINDGAMVVSFYGYKDNSEHLWLTGSYSDTITMGETLSLNLEVASGGKFGGFVPEDITRAHWGELIINFEDCNNATATLLGIDGQQSMDLVKLAGLQGSELNCQ